jgi:valyl-tRNA synthetase
MASGIDYLATNHSANRMLTQTKSWKRCAPCVRLIRHLRSSMRSSPSARSVRSYTTDTSDSKTEKTSPPAASTQRNVSKGGLLNKMRPKLTDITERLLEADKRDAQAVQVLESLLEIKNDIAVNHKRVMQISAQLDKITVRLERHGRFTRALSLADCNTPFACGHKTVTTFG